MYLPKDVKMSFPFRVKSYFPYKVKSSYHVQKGNNEVYNISKKIFNLVCDVPTRYDKDQFQLFEFIPVSPLDN